MVRNPHPIIEWFVQSEKINLRWLPAPHRQGAENNEPIIDVKFMFDSALVPHPLYVRVSIHKEIIYPHGVLISE